MSKITASRPSHLNSLAAVIDLWDLQLRIRETAAFRWPHRPVCTDRSANVYGEIDAPCAPSHALADVTRS
jgi:hypothetical protein